jgi:hypothetical protein
MSEQPDSFSFDDAAAEAGMLDDDWRPRDEDAVFVAQVLAIRATVAVALHSPPRHDFRDQLLEVDAILANIGFGLRKYPMPERDARGNRWCPFCQERTILDESAKACPDCR